VCLSKETHEISLAYSGTYNVKTTLSGNKIGLKDREWGHIGVISIAGTL